MTTTPMAKRTPGAKASAINDGVTSSAPREGTPGDRPPLESGPPNVNIAGPQGSGTGDVVSFRDRQGRSRVGLAATGYLAGAAGLVRFAAAAVARDRARAGNDRQTRRLEDRPAAHAAEPRLRDREALETRELALAALATILQR